jgi:hypothetical protein
MFDYLEKLRRSPPPVRRRMAGTAAAVVTGVFFLAWLTVSPVGPAGKNTAASETTGPWAALVSGMSALTQGVTNSLSGVRDTFVDAQGALESAAALETASTSPAAVLVPAKPADLVSATTSPTKKESAVSPVNKNPFAPLPVSKEEPMR